MNKSHYAVPLVFALFCSVLHCSAPSSSGGDDDDQPTPKACVYTSVSNLVCGSGSSSYGDPTENCTDDMSCGFEDSTDFFDDCYSEIRYTDQKVFNGTCSEYYAAQNNSSGGSGSGGSSGGYSGSAGSAGSSGGGSGCGLEWDAAACGACMNNSCCSQQTSCAYSQDCIDLINCVISCTTDACVNTCANTYPNGVDPYNSLGTCYSDYCTTDCQ